MNNFFSIIVLIVVLFNTNDALTQHNYDYIWPLGYDVQLFDYTGELIGDIENPSLNFNNRENVLQLDSFYFSFAGTHGSLCNPAGDTLRYMSNGCQIRDGAGNLLINGDSINHDADGFWEDDCNNGSYEAYRFWNHGVMLPDLTNENKAAFFHLKRVRNPIRATELRVSTIEGNEVAKKNQVLINDFFFAGWMASVKAADAKSWWILVHKDDSNKIYKIKYKSDVDSILITEQKIGLPNKSIDGLTGEAFFSHDGTKYYTVDRGNHLQIYDFDRESGLLSNHKHVQFDIDTFFTVGSALSPNQRYLYISTYLKVYQVDLESDDIAKSITLAGEHSGKLIRLGYQNYTLMQLGPDCRIYIAANGSSDRMHVINYPDREGTACEVIEDAIIFPKDYNHPRGIRDSFIVLNNYTLPNFPNFRLDTGEPVCDYSIRAPLTNSEEVILETSMRILLWPNPVSDVLQIDIGHIQNFSGQFVLRNALGQLQKQIDIHSGQRRYQLPVYDMQPGMYFYEISSAGQSVRSGRVVVK